MINKGVTKLRKINTLTHKKENIIRGEKSTKEQENNSSNFYDDIVIVSPFVRYQ